MGGPLDLPPSGGRAVRDIICRRPFPPVVCRGSYVPENGFLFISHKPKPTKANPARRAPTAPIIDAKAIRTITRPTTMAITAQVAFSFVFILSPPLNNLGNDEKGSADTADAYHDIAGVQGWSVFFLDVKEPSGSVHQKTVADYYS